MFVKLSNSYQFVKLSSIVKIESADDYSVLFLASGESHLTGKSLKEWESRLPESNFVRIHRFTIINTDHVIRSEPWLRQSFKIYMNTLKEPVTLSRRFFHMIREKMG